MRKINAKGRELIKGFESLALKAYLCPAGKPTISWGVTGPYVKMGMTITYAEAVTLFDTALKPREAALEKLLEGAPTTDDQFAAMGSLLYNIGEQAFAGSTVLKRHKAGNHLGAADAFLMWIKATVKGRRVVLNGLVRRREAERLLYLGKA